MITKNRKRYTRQPFLTDKQVELIISLAKESYNMDLDKSEIRSLQPIPSDGLTILVHPVTLYYVIIWLRSETVIQLSLHPRSNEILSNVKDSFLSESSILSSFFKHYGIFMTLEELFEMDFTFSDVGLIFFRQLGDNTLFLHFHIENGFFIQVCSLK